MDNSRPKYPTELENKAAQLRALLSMCFGVGRQAFDEIGDSNRDGIMWLAYDLAEYIDIEISQGGRRHG